MVSLPRCQSPWVKTRPSAVESLSTRNMGWLSISDPAATRAVSRLPERPGSGPHMRPFESMR
jgi:hypothetical protein